MVAVLHTARDVSKQLLDCTGAAVQQRDFDQFAPHFLLPQYIENYDGRRYVPDLVVLRGIFDAICGHYEALGVTSVERECVHAVFVDEDRVEAVHEARKFRGSRPLGAPYQFFGEFQRNAAGVWQLSYSMYAENDMVSHGGAMRTAPQPPVGAMARARIRAAAAAGQY